MSQTFTPILKAGDANHLAVANEIIQSYNEHVDVLGGPGAWPRIALLTEGADAQDPAIWNTIQWFMAQNCKYFIDHANPLSDDSKAFRYYTEDTWLAAAGIPGGFAYSYGAEIAGRAKATTGGQIGIGQTRGPWNFVDLQQGLSALKWTLWTQGERIANQSRDGEGRSSNAAAAFAEAESKYAVAAWTDSGSPYGYVSALGHWWYYSDHIFHQTRVRVKYKVLFPNIEVDDTPLVGRNITTYITGSYYPYMGGNLYFDSDHLGVEYEELLALGSTGIFSGDEYETGWLGDVEQSPFTLNPDFVGASTNTYPNFYTGPAWVAKWDFTYSND